MRFLDVLGVERAGKTHAQAEPSQNVLRKLATQPEPSWAKFFSWKFLARAQLCNKSISSSQNWKQTKTIKNDFWKMSYSLALYLKFQCKNIKNSKFCTFLFGIFSIILAGFTRQANELQDFGSKQIKPSKNEHADCWVIKFRPNLAEPKWACSWLVLPLSLIPIERKLQNRNVMWCDGMLICILIRWFFCKKRQQNVTELRVKHNKFT